MEPEYILLIVAGGVFALLLLICCLIEFKRSSQHLHDKEQLLKSYSSDNLKTMEYDVAFYDKKDLKLDFNTVGDEQMTIDDVLNQADDHKEEKMKKAVFSQLEEHGLQVIKGNYRPQD